MGSFVRRTVVVIVVTIGCSAFWIANASAAIYTVTNTHDAGPGSLRDAIQKANATTVADTIRFAIPMSAYPGVNFRTIAITSALSITKPLTIDGTSEPGYLGSPLIRIDDNIGGVGCCAVGLDVESAHTKITGLSITRFDWAIYLASTSSQTVVANNWVGLDQQGNPDGNGIGIFVTSPKNAIGGNTPTARNVISANQTGVLLQGTGATKNGVAGNYIGASPNGLTRIGNSLDGVVVDGAAGNTIGGVTPSARNVISGQSAAGVLILGGTANIVEGNFIGTDATGNAALPNTEGVTITDATGNTVGGASASARNVISGNGDDGVLLTQSNSSTSRNVVVGNLIGTNADGTAAVGNGDNGVYIDGVSDNVIGGSALGAGNVIAGNGASGIHIGASTNTTVAGNFVGVGKSGSAIPNGCDGVLLSDTNGNTIGGTTPGARNVISGNGSAACGANANGVTLDNASGTVVDGNYIGTNALGKSAVGNYGYGVEIQNGSQNNVMGGLTPGARNVISGNGISGIEIDGDGTSNNTVEGNFLGTDASGMTALGNKTRGIRIANSASANTIGGATPGARNVISGNQLGGIYLFLAGANTISGNYVGTNVAGSAAIPNAGWGISVQGSNSSTIGGTTAAARNVISGNGSPGFGGVGIDILDSNSTQILGNYVGTNATGSAALGNLSSGVVIEGSSSNTNLGTADTGARNVISGNQDDGVDVKDTSQNNSIDHDYIGTNAAGTGPLGNLNFGVYDKSTGSGNAVINDTVAFNGVKTALDGVEVDGVTGFGVVSNSIFSNGGLGIKLVNGGNGNQVAPVITSVVTANGTTTISGTFDSAANTPYILQLFGNSACDPSGAGEGQKMISSGGIVTNNSGHYEFAVEVTPALSPAMKVVTATATRYPTGDTSQFSACKS